LVVRGGLGRTFGSLAYFLAVLFLCLGIYILDDAFSDPVAAQAAALIVAAFSIALAAILLFYLLKPSRKSPEDPDPAPIKDVLPEAPSSAVEPSPATPPDARSDLVYQPVYVNQSRIPPRPPF